MTAVTTVKGAGVGRRVVGTLLAAVLGLLLTPGVAPAAVEAPKSCISGACHLAVQKKLKKSRVVHEPAREGSCTACHEPHANGRPGKLRKPLSGVCCECHDGVGSRVQAAKSVHRPITQDKCQACHDPHGSDREHLLVALSGEERRAKSGSVGQELCWRCHKAELATATDTTTSTRFRNGRVNLHALHLKLPKGLICGGCHDPHSSPRERLIGGEGKPSDGRAKAAFEFARSGDGGGCVGGCHKERRYDRVRSVKP